MSVLIEATSVVIRRSAIDEKYPGGLDAFIRNAPRQFCRDKFLVRVGFMATEDVRPYIEMLESHGLVFLNEKEEAVDLLVADQLSGITTACDWAYFHHLYFDRDSQEKVAACTHNDAPKELLHSPFNWKFEGSLSQSFGFTPTEYKDKSLEFLRHENGVDVYLSRLTGKEMYTGRVLKK